MAFTKQNGDLIAVLAKFDATKATIGTTTLPQPGLTVGGPPDTHASHTPSVAEQTKCKAIIKEMKKTGAAPMRGRRGGCNRHNNTQKKEGKIGNLGCAICGWHKFTDDYLELEANTSKRPADWSSRFA